MTIKTYLQSMPKVELHVHLEGSIEPETLLKLAAKNNVPLPVSSVAEIRDWYKFIDFDHFVTIYKTISSCLQTPEDIELITRDFLANQAAQNIRHSEVIYTAYTQYTQSGIPFNEQLDAINRARAWARDTHGISMALIIDISRDVSPEEGLISAQWAVENKHNGVDALGLGGTEINNPPEKFGKAFALINQAGLASLPHAGETDGPKSIWGAIKTLKADRIGHGFRCLEDPALVNFLREKQIPLEVSPGSNCCLTNSSSLAEHPLPQLLDAGLYVTINSDDPPMVNTTLTDEYINIQETFGFSIEQINQLVLNAVHASLLPEETRKQMAESFKEEFRQLHLNHLSDR